MNRPCPYSMQAAADCGISAAARLYINCLDPRIIDL
jgi:hypothetical protein